MTVNWHALAAQTDLAVDNTFGEPIVFIPWLQSNEYELAGPDPDRVIPAAVGVYVNRNARVMPLPGMDVKTVPAANIDLLFSIRDAYLAGVQQGDHVFLVDRGFLGEIAFIEPGDTDRSILHLLRLKE